MKKSLFAVCVAMCAAPAFSDVVYSQNFDGGLASSGWTVTNAVGNSPVVWTDMSVSDDDNYAGNDQSNALTASSDYWGDPFYNNQYNGTFDTTAASATFDLTNWTSSFFSFDVNFQKYNQTNLSAALDTDRLIVMARANAGSWTTLDTFNNDIGQLYVLNSGSSKTYDISAFDGMSNVQVGFRYIDQNANVSQWYSQVDNVVIRAQGVPEPMTLTLLGGLAIAGLRRRKR